MGPPRRGSQAPASRRRRTAGPTVTRRSGSTSRNPSSSPPGRRNSQQARKGWWKKLDLGALRARRAWMRGATTTAYRSRYVEEERRRRRVRPAATRRAREIACGRTRNPNRARTLRPLAVLCVRGRKRPRDASACRRTARQRPVRRVASSAAPCHRPQSLAPNLLSYFVTGPKCSNPPRSFRFSRLPPRGEAGPSRLRSPPRSRGVHAFFLGGR